MLLRVITHLVSYQSDLSKGQSNGKSTCFIRYVMNSMKCILRMVSFKVDKTFGKIQSSERNHLVA